MPDPSFGVLTDEGFVILAQIFCAFGQGADGLSIDGSANSRRAKRLHRAD